MSKTINRYSIMKQKLNRYIFLWLVGFTLLVPVSAQRVYTLDECLQRALENNVRIKNAGNNLEIAKQGSQEAFTKYFPSLSATGTGFMADKGLLQLDMGPGMQMSLMKKGVVGGVSASMPLFTGGQIVNGNKLAKVNIQVNRLQYNQSENEVKLTTENYYWQVVMLKEKLQTITVVEAQLTNLLKDVEASVNAGVTTRNDLLQVQLRQNEIESSRSQIENALTLSQQVLAQYIGEDSGIVDVPPVAGEVLPEHPQGLYRNPESSLVLTNEYHLLQQNLKANKLQRRITVGKYLPTIAIGGGYMYDNLMDKDHPFWMGFATVSIPLSGWWGGSHDVRKQELQVRNAENQLTDQSELLILRMQQNWNDLTDAYKQMQISMRSIEQATENLRLNTDYYKAGTCTMNDLLDAQTLFQQSKDRYVESYARYEVKKCEYLQATGR